MEEEDVRGDRGLSVFRLRAVSRLTLVVRCTEIGYSVSTQVLGFRFGCGWCCVVGFLFGCCWFCVLLLCVSAWWNRGIADEVTMASYGRAVTGTAVMARSANEGKKKIMLLKSMLGSFCSPRLRLAAVCLPSRTFIPHGEMPFLKFPPRLTLPCLAVARSDISVGGDGGRLLGNFRWPNLVTDRLRSVRYMDILRESASGFVEADLDLVRNNLCAIVSSLLFTWRVGSDVL